VSGAWPLAPSLDHVGPMARTAKDLALALGLEPAEYRPARVLIDPRVPRAAADVFESLGATVVEHTPPETYQVFATVQLVEAARVHAHLYPERAQEYGKDVRTRLELAVATDPADYVAASAERERLRSEYGRILAGDALLVTPVAAGPPVIAAEDRSPAGREFRSAVLPLTVPHDVLGIPSCAVRADFDEELGLPVGIQIAAAPWQDGAVLAAAAAFQAATPELQERWP
jgi:aspartyl-tRNA(Asn)/glutamyl-tRNA(Gln) amidotransferase subunit A